LASLTRFGFKVSSKSAPSKASAAKLRSWRVTILRNRAHYLGDVQAPDEGAPEAAAVSEFKLSDGQRKRLLVQKSGAELGSLAFMSKRR
jgi:hypothetical protein